MTAAANCGGTWDQGYIVFVDDDGDINRSGEHRDGAARACRDRRGVSLAVANNATYFSYASTGLGRPDVGGNPPYRKSSCAMSAAMSRQPAATRLHGCS